MGVIKLRFRSEPISYGLVLIMAYLDMLLCWDLLKNNGQLFGDVFSTTWGLGVVTTVFVAFLLFQITCRDLISLFSALLVTLLALPLFVLCFSYVYSANGVCEMTNSPELCIYHSVTIMSSLGVDGYDPVGVLAMYFSWQAFLGLMVIPILISQLLALMHEYRHVRRSALPM